MFDSLKFRVACYFYIGGKPTQKLVARGLEQNFLAALDQKPAYGNIALLNGTCHGTSGQCTTQFAGDSNSLKSDVMRIAAQLSTQNRNVDKVVLAKRRNKN